MRARAPEHPTKEVGGGTREKAASASFFFFVLFSVSTLFYLPSYIITAWNTYAVYRYCFHSEVKLFLERKFRREKFKDHESFDVRILAVGILELLEVDLRYFQLAK